MAQNPTGALAPSPAHSTPVSPAHIVRRRLAPNVVCMFSEDRPPIVNIRRRGRNPRSVISLWTRRRLMPGDMAEMCNAMSPNYGTQVRIIGHAGRYERGGGLWTVESIWQPLELFDSDTRELIGESCMRADVLDKNLRRISNRTP